MLNKEEWIKSYGELNPEDQLEIARTIRHELYDNEWNLEPNEYSTKESEVTRSFFKKLINANKKISKLRKIENIFKQFDNLSSNQKRAILSKLSELIKECLKQQEQERKEQQCNEFGHEFGEWEERNWTTYASVCIDHEIIPNYEEKHTEWRRVCTRCGYVEKTRREPIELVNTRREQKRKARIKKLETELAQLKSKDNKSL
jgi:hypothetical protein